jgi:aryl-alcohol dehydrogenase-like predicted oxidoreductase
MAETIITQSKQLTAELGPLKLVLGGNVFGWTADKQASFEILDAFVAEGGRMIDTADVYWMYSPGMKGGESESMIGEWIQSRGARSKILIATKVGAMDGPGGTGLQKSRILGAVEESLRRLRTDYIDTYYTHVDDQKVEQTEVLETLDQLVKQGKVRSIAASNITAARLRSAMAITQQRGLTPYVALQPHYNLVERKDFEQSLAPLAKQENIAVFPFFALASGFLTGKYRSKEDLKSARGGFVEKYLTDDGFRVIEVLTAVGSETKSTPGEVALAWLNWQPSVTAPIASARNMEQFKSLIRGARLKLTPEQIGRLDRVSSGA